jgi:hypothetical protein
LVNDAPIALAVTALVRLFQTLRSAVVILARKPACFYRQFDEWADCTVVNNAFHRLALYAPEPGS